MKKVGIIFAMQEELQALLKSIKLTKNYNIFELTFYEGTIFDINLILVQSGVGKVNAARACQILIDNMQVDYLFNIGVAGSISKEANVLDIIIGQSLVQHDFDITAFNHEKGYIPKVGTYIKSDEYLVRLANTISLDDPKQKLLTGTIASGDIFCTQLAMSEKINHKFNALCVEMEGASVAQVCTLDNIPFLVIRSISDSLNKENNTLTYEEFLIKSSQTIATFMIKLLKKLSQEKF